MRLKILPGVLVLFIAAVVTAQTAKPGAATKQSALPSAPSASVASSTNTGLPSEATVNAFLRKMFGYEESLTWRILAISPSEAPGVSEVSIVFSSPQGQQQARFFVTGDNQHAIMGDMIPFGTDPFAGTRTKLQASQSGIAKGPADAKLVFVEFADLECPACKAAQPTLAKLQQEYPNARFVFQNYPLEQLHPWAMLAAKYVDCIGRNANDKVWDFMTQVFDNQGQITKENAEQKLPEFAQAAGVDASGLSACVQSPDTYIRIQKSMDLGKAVGVNQTPTLFVNGRKIPQLVNVPYENVKQVVQFEADDAK
jgi:protein-disulfide isomerase